MSGDTISTTKPMDNNIRYVLAVITNPSKFGGIIVPVATNPMDATACAFTSTSILTEADRGGHDLD